MKAFQNDIARFEKLSAQVLGASGDSLQTHRDFAEELGLQFPLLVDDGSIRKDYGSGRITHLIDRNGIVRVGRVTGEEPHILVGHEGEISHIVIDPLVLTLGADNNAARITLDTGIKTYIV